MFGLRKGLRIGAWLALFAVSTWSATPCVCAEDLPLTQERLGRRAETVPAKHCHDAREHDGDTDEDGRCDHHAASEQRLVLKGHGGVEAEPSLSLAVGVAFVATAAGDAGRAVALPPPTISSSGRSLLGRRCTLLL